MNTHSPVSPDKKLPEKKGSIFGNYKIPRKDIQDACNNQIHEHQK